MKASLLNQNFADKNFILPDLGEVENFKPATLTKREKEIVNLIADGKTSQNISIILYISIHTVNNHRKNIYKKLHTNNLAGLIRFAIHSHLI
ncbi:MAG: helix-turn-helix transcriptional regulator [Daejeonella sp.]